MARFCLSMILAVALAPGCDRGGTATVTSPTTTVVPPTPPPPASPPPVGGVPPFEPGPPSPVSRTIWGRVLDFDTNTTVAGARVSLWNDSGSGGSTRTEVVAVTTGGDGRFNLSMTTIGFWWVRVERTGYEAAQFAHYSELAPFDFSGDVALRVYRTLVIRPGESIDVQLAAAQPTDSCGPDGWFYCRRVVVESPGGGTVALDVTATDGQGVLLSDDAGFEDFNKPTSTITVAPGAIWVVWTTHNGSRQLRARLTARRP